MQLQGRNLEPGLSGADVSLLHFELNLIGFLPPADEALNNTFGKGTQQAVINFQAKYGLEQTGMVDKATAQAINAQVAQQVPIDVLLARLGEAIARYQAQIDQPGQGIAGLAQEVARLSTALQAMQIECAQVKAEAAASAKQVVALEQALAAAQERIAELEKFIANPNGGQTDSFVVRGQVLRSDQQPLVETLVQALHADEAQTVFLNAGKTNNDGRYEISYTVASLIPVGKKQANLFVQVLGPDQKVLVASAVYPQADPVETIDLVVKIEEKPKAGFAVLGHVRDGAGNPLAGLLVRARDRDLPSLQRNEPLGEADTDKEGFYRIKYTADKFSRMEKGSADLQVRVYPPNSPSDDKTPPLAESATRFNAQPEETLDLVMTTNQYRGPSEYERLLAAVTPLIEQVPIANLTTEDIDFLAGETGEDGKHLALLVQAAVCQEKSKSVDPTILTHVSYNAIPAAVFYGWFRLGLPTDWETLRLQRISTLRKALLDAIDQNIIPASLRETIESFLALVPNPQIMEFAKLPGVVTLSPDKIQSVLTQADGIAAITDEVLAQLVEQNSLAANDAQSVGLSVSLHRLTGGDPSLVSTMLDTAFVALSAGKLKQARDLAALEPKDWESVLERADSPTPGGVTRAEYARSLAMDAVSEFPHAAFVQRATRIPEGIPDQLNTIQPLLAKNANAIALDFNALDLTGVSETDQKALREAHADLKRLANLHPGLDLYEVLSKQDGAGKVIERVHERVGWLSTVFDLNQKVDFLNLDYLPDSADLKEVQFGNLSEEARGLVLQELKAHQRIYTVTNNVISAREIMQAGFHSASAIALTRAADFADKTGLANGEALDYHATALDVGNEAAVSWLRLYESARDMATTPIRSIPSHNEFFKPLTGFQDLINSQPWCECAHCQSVLSPAAYFVDLMYYIEENILKDSFRGNEHHPLHLQYRRPDLWDLELTCKNTDEYVPYLDLVNEILERYLKEAVPTVNGVAPLADSEAVYQHLAAQEGSFKQPFSLPIERLEILLEHFGLSRYAIANAMGANKEIQARARLKISLKEYELMTIARDNVRDLPFFTKLFKLTHALSISSSGAELDPMEMQALLSATGLTHEIVAGVLNTKFVNDDGSNNAVIEVVLGKRKPDDVQNNSELVNHLTLRRLDRIHRFVRLWRKLPWTVAELDYVLARLTALGLDPGIPKQALNTILNLLDLNAAWSLPIDELMALWDVFPQIGLREPISLFDRLFNQQPFLNRDGPWPPNPAIRFTHPAWANSPQGVSTPNNNTLSRLLAGLQLDDKELVELIDSLLAIPAIDHRPATQAPPSDKSIELSRDSISLLYRHARLMRLLKSSMTDFVKLVKLTPRIADRPASERILPHLEDVASVLKFAAWQQTSGFSLDEIIYVKGEASPQGALDPATVASKIITRVQTEQSLQFADTVFMQLGLTAIQSRQIVSANVSNNAADPKAFEALPDGTSYRLNAGFDPGSTPIVTVDPPVDPAIHIPIIPLVVPPIVPPLDPTPVRNLLYKYHALHILDVALGSALNVSPEETKELRELAHPMVDAAAIAQRLHDGDLAGLVGLIADTLRYRALFKSKVFDVESLRFVRNNRPVLFGLPGNPANQAITVQVVCNVAAYVALATATDADFTTASDPADMATLQTVLSGVAGVGAASAESLAKTLRTDETRIGALKPHLLTLPSNPFDALGVLARCLVFTEQLGVSGETLSLTVQEYPSPSVTFDRLSRAAEDIYGAFRAKYPQEKTFQEKMEPFEDMLRARKRAGLVDFIVSQWPEPFSDPNKLYEYFLIDVLLEGCARTSRVVAAISSLQLYVQRVLMNLEQSNDWDGTKNGVYARFTDPHKQAEWYWREHYRVWEANRKVFLYPENYIEPELRDDKTPLFQELEDTLLQQEISESNVQDAYAKYLTGFDEVAHLKIAGAYYDSGTDPDHDALHLFGVTHDAPPIYYYRVINNTLATAPHISAWQKLTLQIPVQKVSPILFEGRLYVFWLETTTKPLNSFVGGSSEFEGYRHAVRIKYSTLRLDGVWSPPQSLRFSDGVTTEESRILNDPCSESDPTLEERIDAARQRVADLTRKENDAMDEVERTRAKKDEADREMGLGVPAVGSVEVVEAELVQSLVDIAGSFAYVSTPPSFFTDDSVAKGRAELASWEVLATSVPATVGELRKANVSVTVTVTKPLSHADMDPPWRARRKIAASNANSNWEQARAEEQRVFSKLDTAGGELKGLLDLPPNIINVRWDRSKRNHKKPLDNYTPEGWEWDRVYPDVYSPPNTSGAKSIRLMLVPRNEPAPVLGQFQLLTSDEVDLPAGVLRQQPSTEQTNFADVTRISNFHGQLQLLNGSSPTYPGQGFYVASFWLNKIFPPENIVALAPANADLQIVNGAPVSVIIDANGYPVWMKKGEALSLLGTRLGTTLTPNLTTRFGHTGASSLLNAGFQSTLMEFPPNISPVAGQGDLRTRNPFHLTNPYLTYFRETFFHIPFLVANHLNSQQKFAETQRWYHYIFNPTAADGIPWRYREFNELMMNQSLREMLTDPLALAAYRADPFNPHAIARTRLSAYQKSIVMKYIDNLLDWGDSLFNQFTMESVNEATMLYVMAQDILGPRPPELGSCGEGKVSPKDYKTIRPGLNSVSDFLIELELPRTSSGVSLPNREANKLVVKKTRKPSKLAGALAARAPSIGNDPTAVGPVGVGPSNVQPQVARDEFNQSSAQYWTNVGGTSLKALYDAGAHLGDGGLTILGTDPGTSRTPENKAGYIDSINPTSGIAGGQVGVPAGDKIKHAGTIPMSDGKDSISDRYSQNKTHPDGKIRTLYYAVDLVPKNAVFCIPPNMDLLAYWARVEDRLFKIRNCMDIAGVRRRLELFAPEIDPRLLVRMKHAGLSLDDVLNSISDNVPPYRFTYLIDKAKQYAGTLQSFGAQLLSALEKHDGEELANLRAVHEQNLLKMRTRMTQLEIDAAEDAIEGLRRQKAAAEYRQGYFHSLSDVGLLASESNQQQHQREASNFRTQASIAQFIAAILSIIPDVGAPTAMKFGGSQLGAAGRAAADGLNALAAFNEMSASMAGMEASNQRRDQDWKHQEETARRDVAQIEKQITAAEIRRDIAVHALEVHEKTIDQSEEVFEFFRNQKFTNINLYRLLSTRLQGLHRQAFNAALSMAKMAEQAYRAERTDDSTLLGGSYWDAGSAGLLAGERLLIDLQDLERQYIEKNYRQLEVEQSFSLAQFAPDLLETLRLTGECTFEIPEWFFDLTYPGQYRRRLKAIRLTIPCVTGPYTNVGATLRLKSSEIRLTVPSLTTVHPPTLLPLTPVPLRHTVAIATSKAQYDAGVFDFNFRDERYMPFEGAGAISKWELSLPKSLPAFDYYTISDVILHLSYTAEFDEGLKAVREAGAQSLITLLKISSSMTRLFSLRQEFPDVFHRLISSPPNTPVDLTIEQRHFPFFLLNRTLVANTAVVRFMSSPASLASVAGLKFAIGAKVESPAHTDFRIVPAPESPTQSPNQGVGLSAFELGSVLGSSTSSPSRPGIVETLNGNYVIMLTVADPLAPNLPGNGRGAIDPAKLHDIILEIGYSLA